MVSRNPTYLHIIIFHNILLHSPFRAGLLPATVPLKMVSYLVKETEIVPWAAALRHLSAWKIDLADSDLMPMIDAFILHLIGPIYDKIGWEDKGTHTEK